MEWVSDKSGRFGRRPHYLPEELDAECEGIVSEFLHKRYGDVRFPISTDDLTVMIEQEGADVDLYADLSEEGPDVEGVTEFVPGQRPLVKIAKRLSEDSRMENRFRTTLTHEFSHVHFHGFLWELQQATPDMLRTDSSGRRVCKRDTIVTAAAYDWMEWQAGYGCGALLMPRSVMREIVSDIMGKGGGYRAKVAVHSEVAQDLIEGIVQRFSVSNDAAHVRLLKLRYITDVATDQKGFWD